MTKTAKQWVPWLAATTLFILACAGSALFEHPATVDASVNTVFTPVADSYVDQSKATSNFGAANRLRTDGLPIVRSYLRFNVQGLTGTPSRATLRLYLNSSSSAGVDVNRVADNTWDELKLNFNNAPALGSRIASSGSIAANTWIALDVSSWIVGNGTWSMALTTSKQTAIALSSREAAAYAPQLVIEMAPATAVATATGTSINTATPTRSATNTPTSAPTNTPTNTSVPTNTPTAVPTNSPTATSTPPTGSSYQPTFPIRAAFFYPWFANAWTQGGVFPYTNYMPSLGYYSSADSATIDTQLNLASQAHLQVFISSWWGQGHHTDTSFAAILNHSEQPGSPNPNMRWAIYYEQESQGDPTVSQIVSDLNYLKTNYFSHPGFLRVNNKPVVFVYADGLDGCGMSDRWAQASAQVTGGVYVVLKVFAGYKLCASQPDSWHQYSPAVAYDTQLPYAAVAAPGFWKSGDAVRLARDPLLFESNVQKMVASGANWQLITTWNEWGEGTAVEPAQQFNSTYIDILCRNLPGTTACAPATPTPIATATRTNTPAPTNTPTIMPPPTTTPVATATSTGTAGSVPAFDHIFVVLEENHSSTQVIGSTSAPYLNSLASQNGLATNYYAVTHPSLPNYLALIGGSTFSITTDCTPATCPVNAANLADRIEASGRTWKSYQESMPSNCATTSSGTYVPRHNPFVYFNDIRTNSARCSAHDVPYTQLAGDLSSAATTPNFVWITPNLCNDMHDCSVSTGDTWLKNQLPAIFASPAWTTQKSVLIVLWDENDGSAGNQVAALVVGPSVKPGYQSTVKYTHYSALHTIEQAWGLAPLTTNDANATIMTDFWR